MKKDDSLLNCWDFKNCGKTVSDPDGDCRLCPVLTETRLNGLNRGTNAGRVCWFVEGTYCDIMIRKTKKGDLVQKYVECLKCDFFKYVQGEEGTNFADLSDVFEKLRGKGPQPYEKEKE